MIVSAVILNFFQYMTEIHFYLRISIPQKWNFQCQRECFKNSKYWQREMHKIKITYENVKKYWKKMFYTKLGRLFFNLWDSLHVYIENNFYLLTFFRRWNEVHKYKYLHTDFNFKNKDYFKQNVVNSKKYLCLLAALGYIGFHYNSE